MATYTVTSTSTGAYDPASPSKLTLEGALIEAENNPGADTIQFAPNIEELQMTGYVIRSDVTIDGDLNDDGIPDLVLDRNYEGRHFFVAEEGALTLEGVELHNGRHFAGTGGDASSSILNEGDLTLKDVHFVGNYAAGGNGATGGQGSTGENESKATGFSEGAKGGTGYRGQTGGEGGDAATVINDGGTVTLDGVVFDESNAARPGTGGKGGTGGTGGRGGEGSDAIFPYDPTGGGDGGTGGSGGYQGYHGQGAYGLLTIGGTVEGDIVSKDDTVERAQTPGLNWASGGTGGSGGIGGKWAFGRWPTGDKGSNGSGQTTNRGNLETDAIVSKFSADLDVDAVDARFKVADVETATEGDTVTFDVQRLSQDDGFYAVDWAVSFTGDVQPEDFQGATSGTILFTKDGADVEQATLQLSKDGAAEGTEAVTIVLSNPRAPGGEDRDYAVENGTFQILDTGGSTGSGQPTDGDDVLKGTKAADVINALAGDDLIKGKGGRDTLKGDNGEDTIKGGGGGDQLYGGADDDKLVGGGGKDLLEGGAGDDVLKGGKGADTFVFGADDGENTILDFQVGQDKLDLEGFDLQDMDMTPNGGDLVLSYEDLEITLVDVGLLDFI